ncbi:MAG TPA: CCA tRNA nucleotidyltransferase [Nitrososphaera sp.]|nr:CCA tRNA nucleotidyltransferase [Nitrososphaera sp.]
MSGIGAVVEKVLPLCEPSPSEVRRITAVAEKAKDLVEKQVSGMSDVVSVIFGGSFAKGTWLRGDADIDIFFKVKSSVSVQRFEELGRSVGLKALGAHRARLRYSDHPYVEAFVRNVRINVVPCYDVEPGRWQSAADRSPFHTEFISRNFDDEKRKQTRLLKKFLKSVGIYGAQISTAGFSGYVSEVLVHKYGSFEETLRAAADWQERQIVATTYYDPDVIKGFRSPVIIIDPIDSRRNLGTAISPESVGKFMLAARSFVDQPSVKFFKGYRRGIDKKRLYSNVLVAEFTHRERSPDVVWGQLRRGTSAIAKQLELAGFTVVRSSCITDEKRSAALAFLLESMTLPPYTKKRGPEIFRRRDVSRFLAGKEKSHMVWVDREMRVTMLVDRKATDAVKYARWLLQSADSSGFPKDLIIAGKLKVYHGNAKTRGVAKEAVSDVVSTERLIFG